MENAIDNETLMNDVTPSDESSKIMMKENTSVTCLPDDDSAPNEI